MTTDITITPVVGSDAPGLPVALELFGEVFPEYAHYASYLRTWAEPRSPSHPAVYSHVWLVEQDGNPVGVRFFSYVHTRNFGYSLFTGIRPAFRSHGIGGWLAQRTLSQLRADGVQFGQPELLGYLVEVEKVEGATDEADRQIRERRLAFHLRNGARMLDVAYLEPPAPPGDDLCKARTWPQTPKSMHLLFYSSLEKPLTPSETTNVIEGLYLDVYQASPDNPYVQQAINSVYTGGKS